MWVYIYQNWVEKEMKNAYIGEYVETIYTIPYFQDTSGSVLWQQFISIYKAGYRPVKVIINSKDCFKGTSSWWWRYAWSYHAISITNWNIEWTSYLCTCDPWIWQSDNTPWIIKRLSWALTKYRALDNSSWFNLYWTNTIKFTIEEDKWEAVINWNTLSWTCTADEKSFIWTLFDSASLWFSLWVIRAGNEWTARVIYRKVAS